MIPKILHYVWVGDSSKPPLVEQCMASWKKFCPTFQIMEWNEQTANEQIQSNRYAREAFECKKWAFVSDYLRLYALYRYGGIYLDTDVELTGTMEKFLQEPFFTGYENYKGELSPITSCVIGAEKNHPIIADLLAQYDSIFFLFNGEMNQIPNTVRIRDYFARKFNILPPYQDRQISLGKQGTIFPSWFFCVPQLEKENYAIHHFDGSWKNEWKRKILLKIGKYKIICFVRKGRVDSTPLLIREKKLFRFWINQGRQLYFVKKIR